VAARATERHSGPVVAESLIQVLTDAASGRFGEIEEGLRVLPAPTGPAMAIVGLPGVHVIASSAPEAWVRERLAGDLMGPLSPAFIVEFGHQLRRVDDGVDLLLVAHRKDVQAFEDETGEAVVVLGRGLGLRLEVSIEVSPIAAAQIACVPTSESATSRNCGNAPTPCPRPVPGRPNSYSFAGVSATSRHVPSTLINRHWR
jgi:hypothetical protein